jgi:branched-chain amino acid transport system substrate-binding protein
VPFVICTGSADDVTEKGYDYVFRINPPASEYPKAVESFLKEVAKDVKAVALLYENSAFGQSSSKSFEKDAEAAGLKSVLKEGYQAGAIDFKPILTKVTAANPDMIYLVSYVMDASLLMRQSKELGINPKLYVGGGVHLRVREELGARRACLLRDAVGRHASVPGRSSMRKISGRGTSPVRSTTARRRTPRCTSSRTR